MDVGKIHLPKNGGEDDSRLNVFRVPRSKSGAGEKSEKPAPSGSLMPAHDEVHISGDALHRSEEVEVFVEKIRNQAAQQEASHERLAEVRRRLAAGEQTSPEVLRETARQILAGYDLSLDTSLLDT